MLNLTKDCLFVAAKYLKFFRLLILPASFSVSPSSIYTYLKSKHFPCNFCQFPITPLVHFASFMEVYFVYIQKQSLTEAILTIILKSGLQMIFYFFQILQQGKYLDFKRIK